MLCVQLECQNTFGSLLASSALAAQPFSLYGQFVYICLRAPVLFEKAIEQIHRHQWGSSLPVESRIDLMLATSLRTLMPTIAEWD
ncbi:hypothetical protein LMG27174_06859 [Paraburkholderia rhynchosiae]|uniref:Uncharacterized protein n=1 Tax=Paraburkholderia rhynchosiae TaxID=487049 RepID=A0A2N7VS41_9BURK|nr:hypothetical protein C0Z16_34970 [Paraburkholderia rhynchosiae]CAB3742391.1 hypothetical protein LMG27174_06859 [Paraburkholderia rhynchosiae]